MFLGRGIGAALGVGAIAALGRSPAFALETTADASPKSMMRIGLATYKWG